MLADKATVVSSEYAYSKLDGLNLNKNFQFSKYLTEKIKSINNGLDFFNLLRSKKFLKECFTESIYIENINDTIVGINFLEDDENEIFSYEINQVK